MKCPFCKNIGSRVVDSRLVDEGSSVRRRRACLSCNERFTTYERFDGVPLMVVKSDNRREPFDRKKLAKGIYQACNKRKISSNEIEALLDSVERKIREISNTEIKSENIGKFVVEELRKLDKVAYVRFVSVFKEFEEASSFIDEVEALKKEEKK